MLPALMHRISAAFALGSCSFRVEKERESTARVTVWRHLGVTRSYTMEASFCGFDKGPFKVTTLQTWSGTCLNIRTVTNPLTGSVDCMISKKYT